VCHGTESTHAPGLVHSEGYTQEGIAHSVCVCVGVCVCVCVCLCVCMCIFTSSGFFRNKQSYEVLTTQRCDEALRVDLVVRWELLF